MTSPVRDAISSPLWGPTFQLAYVTTDLDAAQKQFIEHTACSTFLVLSDVHTELDTPAGSGTARAHIALGRLNDLIIEIIQPLGGLVDVYTDTLPSDGGAMSFHHAAAATTSIAAARRQLAARGRPVLASGRLHDHAGEELASFLYADFADVFGHHLELVEFTTAGEAFNASIPHGRLDPPGVDRHGYRPHVPHVSET